MRIDVDNLCVLAICDTCNTRMIRHTEASAWVALARHLKSAHGDLHAARRAADAARHYQRERHMSR